MSLPGRSHARSGDEGRCDYPFLEFLEESFCISQFSLRSAFVGVPPAPKEEALSLCEWAMRAAGHKPEEAGDLLRAWAKKNRVGAYDRRLIDAPPLTWEQTEHERRVREERE